MTGNAVALQRPSAVGPPISFLYLHFHNCIRGELDGLATSIRQLEAAQDAADVHERLLLLKERYGFLEQIYSYHSSVEDEVSLHACPRMGQAACTYAQLHELRVLLQAGRWGRRGGQCSAVGCQHRPGSSLAAGRCQVAPPPGP